MSRCSVSSVPPTRPCSRRRGRTSRTRSSRRSPSAAPSSPPPSAAFRKSCGTERTGSSSPPVTRPRWRQRSRATSRRRAAARSAARCGDAFGGRLFRARRLHDDRGRARAGCEVKKRLLMVGRSRYSLPLSPSLDQKFAALAAELDVRVLASSGGGTGTDPRFRLVRPVRPRALDGAGVLRTAALSHRS